MKIMSIRGKLVTTVDEIIRDLMLDNPYLQPLVPQINIKHSLLKPRLRRDGFYIIFRRNCLVARVSGNATQLGAGRGYRLFILFICSMPFLIKIRKITILGI